MHIVYILYIRRILRYTIIYQSVVIIILCSLNYNVRRIPFQIDFESMTVRSVTSARLLEDREQRQRRLNDEKLKKIESEINGKYCIMYYFILVN